MTFSDEPAESGAPPPHPQLVRASYTRVAIVLHWIIAFAILMQLALGWGLHQIPAGPARFGAFQLHKSIGLTILLLSLGRLGWRLAHRPPPEDDLPRWQQLAAHFVHIGLYGIMIGLPLSGWVMVSTSKLPIPTRLFGVVPWPAFPGMTGLSPEVKAGWNRIGSDGHSLLVYVTVAMLVLHLGAVLKHQLLDRDGVLSRMVPGVHPGWREPRLWALLILALASLWVGYNVLARPRGATRPVTQPVLPPPAPLAPSPVVTPGAAAISAISADAPPEAGAQAALWRMRKGQLGFATSWGGAPISGSFGTWTADIQFAPDALAQSSLIVHVDLASASTGDKQRDAALPSSDWFDTATHPSATFRSQRIKARGGANYVAVGSLELRGVRRTVEVPFTVKIEGDHAVAHGALTLDRTSFGVGQGDWAATDQIPAAVAVSFSLQAIKNKE